MAGCFPGVPHARRQGRHKREGWEGRDKWASPPLPLPVAEVKKRFSDRGPAQSLQILSEARGSKLSIRPRTSLQIPSTPTEDLPAISSSYSHVVRIRDERGSRRSIQSSGFSDRGPAGPLQILSEARGSKLSKRPRTSLQIPSTPTEGLPALSSSYSHVVRIRDERGSRRRGSFKRHDRWAIGISDNPREYGVGHRFASENSSVFFDRFAQEVRSVSMTPSSSVLTDLGAAEASASKLDL
ncbi:hypothetical protein NL676_025404 [Syzygium grande]|nr:hypothetical protein NL676_025404 [Syzygium grande]